MPVAFLPPSPAVHSAFSDYMNSEISVLITWYLALKSSVTPHFPLRHV